MERTILISLILQLEIIEIGCILILISLLKSLKKHVFIKIHFDLRIGVTKSRIRLNIKSLLYFIKVGCHYDFLKVI